MSALLPAVTPLTAPAAVAEPLVDALSRGYFRPPEEAALWQWFGRFLTVREALWEVIDETSLAVEGDVRRIESQEEWRCFVLGYGAACSIVRLDFFLVRELAQASLVRRKLNEGSSELRIPRKQFTRIFRSLAHPRKALTLYRAMRWAAKHRAQLDTMAQDPVVGFLAQDLEALEAALKPSKRAYLRRWLDYREHSLRRRGASGSEQTVFSVLEASGRTVAEVHNRWRERRITPPLQAQLCTLLAPGDVLITRKEQAFSNLFLPGYWPHAALYIGSAEERAALGIQIDGPRAERWSGTVRFLEALKDGVRFRPPEETLAVDAVAVLRPQLEGPQITEAIRRAVVHEGKLYNFDFDFFRSDRLVCTEVIYRGFDGIGEIQLDLQERSGRWTLSAEDLLALALRERFFRVVATCGAPGAEGQLLTGAAAKAALEG
jgi:hypothetical protein